MPEAATLSDKSAIRQPEWNSSALTMRMWYNDLVRWIPHQDKAYRSLIERGFYRDKDKVIASSIKQALDITEGHICSYSFSDPAPRDYVQSPAAFAAALQRTNQELADAAAAAGAPAPAPSLVPTFPTELPKGSAVSVAASVIQCKRNELCDTILATVPDDDKAEELRQKCGGDGCHLLRYIFTESSVVSDKVSGAIDREMLNLMTNGLAEPTLACFNRWKREYKSWNESNTTNVLPDSILAARYAAVVRKLGGKIETELDTEIKVSAAKGDLAKTIACIETVLTDREADDVVQGKGGALASQGFDPRKNEAPTDKPPLVWNPKMRRCRNHDLKGCNGKHLNADCPLAARAKRRWPSLKRNSLSIPE